MAVPPMTRLGYLWAQWRHGKGGKDPTFRVAPSIQILRDVGKLPREAKVLDLGARNSIEPRLLREAGWLVTAVDLCPRAWGIRYADMHRLPFADGAFDVVFASHVLEHAHTPDLALKEVCRVLRLGGLLWAAWPCGFSLNVHDRVDYGSSTAFCARLWFLSCKHNPLWWHDEPTESRVLVRLW